MEELLPELSRIEASHASAAAAFREEMSAHRYVMDAHLSSLESVRQKAADAKSAISDELAGEARRLEEAKASHAKALEDHASRMAEMQASRLQLESLISDKSAYKSELDDRIASATKNYEHASRSRAAAEEEMKQMSQSLFDANAALSLARKDKAELELGNQALRDENGRLSDQRESLRMSVMSMTNDARVLEERMAKTRQ